MARPVSPSPPSSCTAGAGGDARHAVRRRAAACAMRALCMCMRALCMCMRALCVRCACAVRALCVRYACATRALRVRHVGAGGALLSPDLTCRWGKPSANKTR